MEAVSLVPVSKEQDKAKKEREGCVTDLEHAHACWSIAKAKNSSAKAPKRAEELRPTMKDGAKCFCVGGRKVDSIEHLEAKLLSLTATLGRTAAVASLQTVRIDALLARGIALLQAVHGHRCRRLRRRRS